MSSIEHIERKRKKIAPEVELPPERLRFRAETAPPLKVSSKIKDKVQSFTLLGDGERVRDRSNDIAKRYAKQIVSNVVRLMAKDTAYTLQLTPLFSLSSDSDEFIDRDLIAASYGGVSKREEKELKSRDLTSIAPSEGDTLRQIEVSKTFLTDRGMQARLERAISKRLSEVMSSAARQHLANSTIFIEDNCLRVVLIRR
jgi:hypothetical protein